MSLWSASWCVAVSRAGLSGDVRVGGGGECDVVWWRWVVCSLPHLGWGVSFLGLVGLVAALGWSWGGAGLFCAVFLAVPLVFLSPWAMWDRCGEGPGALWGGLCGMGVSQPGGRGRVVPGRVGPRLICSRGLESAVYGRGADCHVCGVRGSGGRGITGVLWPPCGACGSGVGVFGRDVSSPWWGGGLGFGRGVGLW